MHTELYCSSYCMVLHSMFVHSATYAATQVPHTALQGYTSCYGPGRMLERELNEKQTTASGLLKACRRCGFVGYWMQMNAVEGSYPEGRLPQVCNVEPACRKCVCACSEQCRTQHQRLVLLPAGCSCCCCCRGMLSVRGMLCPLSNENNQ